jgi:hypothetical protein
MTAASKDGRRFAWLRLSWLRQSADLSTLLIATIVIAQAAWLSIIIGRGWYTEADIPNLAAGNGQRLNWDYLSSSVGGHFGAPGRLIYWTINRAAPLNWPLTVAIRVGLQAIATVLLYRLLVTLVGRRRWLALVVACYAFSPLLLPGIAWLSSGIGLTASQVFVLLTLSAHVRYTRSGRARHAVQTGIYLLLAIIFSDQALLTVLMLPILSLGFLHSGSPAERLRASCRSWFGWTMVVAAVGVFAGFYLSGDYNTGSSHFGPAPAWEVARLEWLEVLGPALVGGPWRWASNAEAYVSYARPPVAAVLLGQLAFLVLLVAGMRSTGRRATVAWMLPVAVGIGGVLLVGRGRYDVLGTFISPLLRYSFSAAVALALGVALSLAGTREEADLAEPNPDESAAEKPDLGESDVVDSAGAEPVEGGPRRGIGVREAPKSLTVAVTGLMLAGSIVSGVTFAKRYWQNPAEPYVRNLLASARAVGPRANVYDSAISGDIVPYLEPNHYVSDVLGLAGVHLTYQGQSKPEDPASETLVVAADGRLVRAMFLPSADAEGPAKPGCGTYIGGKGTWTIPLSAELSVKDWFLRLELYEPRPSTVSVQVLDRDGTVLRLSGGGQVLRFSRQVEVMNIRLPISAPKAVVVHSDSAATTLCLVHTYIGVPLPKEGR